MPVHVAYPDTLLTVTPEGTTRRTAADAECVAAVGDRVLVGTRRGLLASDGPWREVDGLPTGSGVSRPVLAAAGPGTAVAASNEGVSRTDDWGGEWARLADAPADATTCRGLAVA